ncbi:unnamed protein product [marine sediment metagenome]|uniref:Uncharacterized protein n=1 Tax=marine sediment metagenome TaxID=412755 RepID=X0Y359_9ZZZZ
MNPVERGTGDFFVTKSSQSPFTYLMGEEIINRQGGTQVILSATLSYGKYEEIFR